MGRKKFIEDTELEKLTNIFIVEKCKSNPRYFKFTDLASFICKKGFPNITARLLQRNQIVRGCLEEWKTATMEHTQNITIAYKTLDVESFIKRNPTFDSLRKALSELDNYYKSVCEAATDIMEENRKLKKKISELSTSSKQYKKTAEEADTELVELQRNLSKLSKENKLLREVVDIYVYPEIANELLKRKGLLKNTAGMISTEAIDDVVITSSTNVYEPVRPKKAVPEKKTVKSGSNIITGLFDKYIGGEQ